MTFDPFGWLAHAVPEQLLHQLIRLVMLLVLLVFLVHRLAEYPLFAIKALWGAETTLFLVLILAFLLRTTPQIRSSGLREIVVPLIGSALPFGLLLSPPAPAVVGTPLFFYGTLWWMTGATLLTVAGMWTLRRSFSITVEARTLVTSGPYRLIRHPIYLGEMLAAAGVAVIRFSPANMLVLLAFVAIQLCRARWEEGKLTRAFPEYRAFARRSWWFC